MPAGEVVAQHVARERRGDGPPARQAGGARRRPARATGGQEARRQVPSAQWHAAAHMQHSMHMHTGSTHAAVQHTVKMPYARLQPALRMGCSLFHAQLQPLTRAVAGTLQHKLPGVTLATSKDQRVGVTTFRPVLSAPLPPPPPLQAGEDHAGLEGGD